MGLEDRLRSDRIEAARRSAEHQASEKRRKKQKQKAERYVTYALEALGLEQKLAERVESLNRAAGHSLLQMEEPLKVAKAERFEGDSIDEFVKFGFPVHFYGIHKCRHTYHYIDPRGITDEYVEACLEWLIYAGFGTPLPKPDGDTLISTESLPECWYERDWPPVPASQQGCLVILCTVIALGHQIWRLL